MKRRTVLRSLVALPGLVAAVPPELAAQQQPPPEARQPGLPASAPTVPPTVSPGRTETPNTRVTTPDAVAEPAPTTLNPEQLSALQKLSDLIAPSSEDVPGALEAEAAEFLDFLIGRSSEDQISLYRQGLDYLNAGARERFGKPFAALNGKEAQPLLAPLNSPWSPEEPTATAARFLRGARNDILQALFSSRNYISAISENKRPRQAAGFYWRNIE